MEPDRSLDWRNVQTVAAPIGERVEVWAEGWGSVAQGWYDGKRWHVWFGSEVTRMRPGFWRALPPVPKWIVNNRKAYERDIQELRRAHGYSDAK